MIYYNQDITFIINSKSTNDIIRKENINYRKEIPFVHVIEI